ncbi:MAG TPA: AzlC family ABC transporter permease [Rhizobiaceae bacterium]|nr:AzlC family ABC transporter permease [Rhizobiaceae bacterium]
MTAEAIFPRSGTSQFLRGARLGMPVVIASAPFAILFGALAVDNGMSVMETTLMSATIFAGASQMVGLELFGHDIPPWLVVFSIFAVNFRHVLYSAAVGRRVGHWTFLQKTVGFFFLVDPQYAETERKAERGESIGFGWYMGMALTMYLFWVATSALGAIFGKLLPDTHALGIDFLLPIYFLGLVMGFRKRPLWLPIVVASAVVSVVAFKFVGSPWHVSIGAAAGIVLAAAMPPRGKVDLGEGLEAEV